MRLDKIRWDTTNRPWNYAELGFARIWHSGDRYDIWCYLDNKWWSELDALSAQCVLFDLCSRSDP